MKSKYGFVCGMLLGILLVSAGLTSFYVYHTQKDGEQGEFTVVTSFYPMYIAAQNIIGDVKGVTLFNLSEPQTGCLHDFQLTPEDMKLLSGADVFIINGGGIESFMEEIAADYPALSVIEAGKGLSFLSGEEGDNAHLWMSVSLYRAQAAAIAEGLCGQDPAHAKQYRANAEQYDKKLAALEERQKELAARIQGGSVVLLHEAYAYLAEDLGLEVCDLFNLDEERQVSAGEMASLLSVIRTRGVRYVFAEERYGKGIGDMLKEEAGVHVLYLDPLNRGDYDADSYLTGMEKNLEAIEAAMAQE